MNEDLIYNIMLHCDIKTLGRFCINQLSFKVFNSQQLWKEKLTTNKSNIKNYKLEYQTIDECDRLAKDTVNVLFILKTLGDFNNVYVCYDNHKLINILDYDFYWIDLNIAKLDYDNNPSIKIDISEKKKEYEHGVVWCREENLA